jgi:solute carrier family 10 (sodium/bile acid cotransporter), member 7
MPSEGGPPPRNAQRALSYLLWLAKDQWFLIGLGIVVTIASQVQVPASQQEIKATVVSYISPAVIFFATGCTLSTRTLIENYWRWKLHLFVQVHCFLVTSVLGFAIVSITATNKHFMDPWLLIGLIINACLPTTIASNVVMTRQANGNTALTVVQTTVGSLLGVFFSPLLVKMYVSANTWYTAVLPAGHGDIGPLYRRTLMQFGLTVYLPLVVGQIVRNVFEEQTTKIFIKYKLSKIGPLALLVLLWQTFDRAFETRAFETVPTSNMIFVIFIGIVNWLLWLIVCFITSVIWLPRKDVVSVCYCVPAKTLTVGVPLSALLWTNLTLVDQAKLQIPMVIFQSFQVLFGSLLTIPLRRWVIARQKSRESRDIQSSREADSNAGSQEIGTQSTEETGKDGIQATATPPAACIQKE